MAAGERRRRTPSRKRTRDAVVTHLLGDELVSATRIEDLEKSRFAVGALLEKRLLLDDDVKKGIRLPDGELKKVSEGKIISGERKFGDQFSFRVLTVPVLLCNDPHPCPTRRQGCSAGS